jgi:hypothetical protein
MRQIELAEPIEDWFESVYDMYVQEFHSEGVYLNTTTVRLVNGSDLERPDFRFSLFGGHGDGASFAGEVMHWGKWLDAVGYDERTKRSIIRLARVVNLKLSVEHAGRWSVGIRTYCETDYLLEPHHTAIAALLLDIERNWDKYCHDKSHELQRSLVDEYEYQQAWGTANDYVGRASLSRSILRIAIFNTRRAIRVWTALNDAGSDVAADASEMLETACKELKHEMKEYRRAMAEQTEALYLARCQGITYSEVLS